MPLNSFGQEVGAAVPDWTLRPRPPRTTMEGRLCRVEPLAAHHAGPLFEAFAGARDARDWTYLPVERMDDATQWRDHVTAETASDDPLHHAIVEQASGRALGKVAFMRIDRANGVIEIGHIVLAPALQRTACATESIFLMLRRAFDELGYRRVEWKCDSLNEPSRRAAERFGFTFEGIFRQAVVTKGRNRDTAWYAMIDRDWPRIWDGFVRWLEPENFRPDGQQRRPLGSFR